MTALDRLDQSRNWTEEERLVIVVDAIGDDARLWNVAWHERAAGHEEELVVAEPLLAFRAARPGLPMIAIAVVDAVCLSEGSIGSAAQVARALGLRNRFELARLLRRARLPSLHRMAPTPASQRLAPPAMPQRRRR